MVKDWTLDDLETVMRDTTAGSRRSNTASVPGSELAPSVSTDTDTDADADADADADDAGAPGGDTVAMPSDAAPLIDMPKVLEPIPPRSARRQAARRPRHRAWRAVVTMVLLGALAAAVVVILLQSAGVISWSFLGPTA